MPSAAAIDAGVATFRALQPRVPLGPGVGTSRAAEGYGRALRPAPLATVDTPVDLPASAAKPQPREPEPVFLSVQADLSLRLGDAPVTREALAPALQCATDGDREQGVPYVRFAVDRSGAVSQIRIGRSSGYPALDAGTLETVRLAAPVPAPPAGIEGDPVDAMVPVAFFIRR